MYMIVFLYMVSGEYQYTYIHGNASVATGFFRKSAPQKNASGRLFGISLQIKAPGRLFGYNIVLV